jgi:hypothetical protein
MDDPLFHLQLKKKSLEMPCLIGDCVLPPVELDFFQRLFNHCLHGLAIDLTMFQELNAFLIGKKYLLNLYFYFC